MSRYYPYLLSLLLLAPACRGDDDVEVQFEIGRAAQRHDIQALNASLDSDDTAIRCYTAKAVSRLRDTRALPLYLKTLNMEECGWKIPAETALRIEEIHERDASPSLVKLLASEDERIRVSAARALAGLHWTDARSAIRNLLITTENQRAKNWYEWSLCRLSEPAPMKDSKEKPTPSRCKRPRS